MKRQRIHAVELKLSVTLRFTSAVTEQQARDFIKAALVTQAHVDRNEAAAYQTNDALADSYQPDATRVFVLQRTTFNTER